MQISSKLSDKDIKDLQQKFYEYFKSGRIFEEFLKEYLLKIGLDEVELTQPTRDGGVDLKAVRKGIGEFSDMDVTNYYIQAKRYKPSNKVDVKKVRELKGTIPFGHKGIMITTSDFTNDALKEASNDPTKPVVMINGRTLIMSCIDNQIGFLFKPIFSKTQMDLFIKKYISKNNILPSENLIEKMITNNDIRARIISVPSSIMKELEAKGESITIIVNNDEEYTFKLNKERKFFSGVTRLLKNKGLLSEEGVITPKKCKWYYNKKNNTVGLYL